MAGAVEIRPFAPGDLALVRLQPAQRREVAVPVEAAAQALWRAGPAFTAWTDGRPVACAGLQERQPHHAHGWAYVGADARPAMLAVTRAMRRALAAADYLRVDMLVFDGFCAGHRWAGLLGFAREGVMRRAGPGGADCHLYSRIKE